MNNVNFTNSVFSSQQVNLSSEKEAKDFESELKTAASKVQLNRNMTDNPIQINGSKATTDVTEDEIVEMIVEQTIINESIRQMKANQERMEDILDEA
ncbi:hypothetical protein [Shewanella sp. YLB-07]|uniref:hypothetical protein n=1 Tax=Shewanella sp. YLB-07 TaxID=2601268 RepID=UPI00128BF75E|nr:hypothetical protein [Shewanella sp. YLB-07]MPY23328.1 hypothetical protein [Shewanella sp. YLB-07]